MGTGLAILVRGSDFAFLYDGGSNDDMAYGVDNRLVHYLQEVHPDLAAIDHLILSHPHQDHSLLLPDISSRYDVEDVWDSERKKDICTYRYFIKALKTQGSAYLAANLNFGDRTLQFSAGACPCFGEPRTKTAIKLDYSSQISDENVNLGSNASMKFLYANGKSHGSPNENSLVVMITLGIKKILMMGGAEGGSRGDWMTNNAPEENSVEGILFSCYTDQLNADMLVVGHHGSFTLSRRGFLDAVDAEHYLVSSGAKKYGANDIVLLDPSVIVELKRRGNTYRTDIEDELCKSNSDKIGPDNNSVPRGCSNYQFKITSTSIELE